ncbi:MAG: T9SS type A sorting domain-containing protein [Paramuribaculum sp.]|nr:T9SS type A sorting domain-containing protein [Paramuribaculum sp.]
MKKIFTLVCLLTAGLATGAYAATNFKSVVIEHADTHVSRITMEHGMTTAFEDGMFVMSCEKGDISYELEDVRHWTFSTESGDSDLWAGISDVANDNILSVNWAGDVLRIGNLPSESRLTVVSVDGRSLLSRVVSGDCEIDLGEFSSGVYIVNVNNQSLKVAVK